LASVIHRNHLLKKLVRHFLIYPAYCLTLAAVKIFSIFNRK
jgi:hypothetical protein